MKFAHLADCHLGGWRQPELKDLNFQSFSLAVEKCIKEKVEFVLIAGDLFDSAYPSIEILKETFSEFKKLNDNKIPVFLIAGSHDYSVSGKTFLDVLEKAGFCKNISNFQERSNQIILEPTIYKNYAIYGYPGKKSSLEVSDIEKIRLQESPGLFTILMLHTAIRDAVKGLPIEAVDEKRLPKADYLALGHLHIKYQKENRVYPGPIYPNSLPELEELKAGSFCIFDNGRLKREDLKTKEVITFNQEVKNALGATEEIISGFENISVKDKIVILKLFGTLDKGKTSDIDFSKIENYLNSRGAFLMLKSTTKIFYEESNIQPEFSDSSQLEEKISTKFLQANVNKFNKLVPGLMKALQVEKLEDEKSVTFEERIFSEVKKIIET
jgi:DNA repair exonuclease SbcCD nuclease subunit